MGFAPNLGDAEPLKYYLTPALDGSGLGSAASQIGFALIEKTPGVQSAFALTSHPDFCSCAGRKSRRGSFACTQLGIPQHDHAAAGADKTHCPPAAGGFPGNSPNPLCIGLTPWLTSH